MGNLWNEVSRTLWEPSRSSSERWNILAVDIFVPRQNKLISSAVGWNRFKSGTTRWRSIWVYEPVSGRRFELIWLLGSIKPDGCLSVQIVFSASGAVRAPWSIFSLWEMSLDVFIVFLWRCSEFQLSWKKQIWKNSVPVKIWWNLVGFWVKMKHSSEKPKYKRHLFFPLGSRGTNGITVVTQSLKRK